MKKETLIPLFVTSIFLFLIGCSTLDTVENNKKPIRSERIILNKKGNIVEYKIKVENISQEEIYITTKAFTPFTPDGRMCFNWSEENLIDVVYNSYSTNKFIDYNTSKNGNYWKKLAPGESYLFSGSINLKKCLSIRRKLSGDNSLATSTTKRSFQVLRLNIGTVKSFVCKNPDDCIKFNKNEFVLSFQDFMKLYINYNNFKMLGFSFEIDEDEKK